MQIQIIADRARDTRIVVNNQELRGVQNYQIEHAIEDPRPRVTITLIPTSLSFDGNADISIEEVGKETRSSR